MRAQYVDHDAAAYGATITYDIPLKANPRDLRSEVAEQTRRTEEFVQSKLSGLKTIT